METIPHQDCLKTGFLQKPHGVNGEVVFQFDPAYAASLESEPVLFLEIDQLLVPWFPEAIRFRTDESALLKLKWIDSELQAREVCGLSVFIKKEDLIADDDSMPLHELVGFSFFDRELGLIGPIEDVADYGGNLILQLTFRGKEVLIPFSEDFLVRFDEEKREMEMDCPDGIFDLN